MEFKLGKDQRLIVKSDLTGLTFNRLTPTEVVGVENGGYIWKCKCSCGGKGEGSGEVIVSARMLLNNEYYTCGCTYGYSYSETQFIEELKLKTPIIALSGGWDPPHVGHYKMFKDAANYGSVIAILNSDDWLIRKKGFAFQSFEERKAILEACKYIDYVTHVDDSDGSVCEALIRIKPDYFGNGGDRKLDNIPEVEVCNNLGIEMVWNIGGGKIQSSSDLVKKIRSK